MYTKNKNGFTMIELIFVIVIMGILSKFGIEILLGSYENYVFSASQAKLQSTSELAVEQITSRLRYRIKRSTIARYPAGPFQPLSTAIGGAAPETVLEWIGYDIDGLRGTYQANPNRAGNKYLPNWSGIIDVDANDAVVSTLSSPATNYTDEDALIRALSYSKFTSADSAFYMLSSTINMNDFPWGINNVLAADQTTALHRISGATNNELTASVGDFSGENIFEYYQLAYTAYAVVHTPTTTNGVAEGTLTLYYNYRPWMGEYYTQGDSSVIATGIDSFGFKAEDTAIKIQICASDLNIFADASSYSVCKEKTIF